MPVTARTLETMIRLATAHAKARLSKTIDEVSLVYCLVLFRACSYGQKLSRLARKHFDESNNFVLFIWRNVIPLTG